MTKSTSKKVIKVTKINPRKSEKNSPKKWQKGTKKASKKRHIKLKKATRKRQNIKIDKKDTEEVTKAQKT